MRAIRSAAAPIDVLPRSLTGARRISATGGRVLPPASNQHVSLRELPDAGNALVLHPVRRARGRAEGGAARHRDPALRLARAGRRQHLPHRRRQARRRRRRTAPIAGAVRAGAVLRDVATPKSSRVPRSRDYDAGRRDRRRPAPHTDFMRGRDVEYEVHLPAGAPSGAHLLQARAPGSSTAFSRAASAVGAIAAVAGARAPSPVAAERVRMGADRFAVVSTDDMSLHAAHMVFDSATAADQALRSLDRASSPSSPARSRSCRCRRAGGSGGASRMTIARYTFLPWLRRGIANQIQHAGGRRREPRDGRRSSSRPSRIAPSTPLPPVHGHAGRPRRHHRRQSAAGDPHRAARAASPTSSRTISPASTSTTRTFPGAIRRSRPMRRRIGCRRGSC